MFKDLTSFMQQKWKNFAFLIEYHAQIIHNQIKVGKYTFCCI